MTSSRPPRCLPRARSRLARLAAAVALVGAIVTGSAAGCGSQDGLVGGACADGYTECSLSCFDLQTDPANCGACGHACPAGVSCVGGSCKGVSLDGAPLDQSSFDANDLIVDGEFCDVSDPAHPVCRPAGEASSGEASADAASDATLDGAPTDGTATDGTAAGGDASDGSASGGDGSSGDGSSGGDGTAGDGSGAGDGCVPPYDTPQNCGSCGTVCSAPNNLCELVDGGFQCTPSCAAPLVDCAGVCVNLARDPKNCGQCGNKCPSQYCFLATCQGTVAGNVVVIGHDFQKTVVTDQQAKLLTNAVFYNSGGVNLLSFEHYADGPTVSNGLSILNQFATAQHIALNVQSTKDDTVPTNDALLATENVVLFWDQPAAPSGMLGSLGTTWAPHLSKFVQGGGIVIALDAAQGVGQMPALLTNAALLAITAHGVVAPGSPADVPLAGLSIARGMTSVYAVEQNSAWFTTSEPMTTKTLYVANVQGQATELLAVQKVIN